MGLESRVHQAQGTRTGSGVVVVERVGAIHPRTRRRPGAPEPCARWQGDHLEDLACRWIKPHQVRYYLERRDAQFEEKMREVLMVYQEVALQNAASTSNEGAGSVITVSLDEKPGVQAIENTAPDLPPVPGQHSTWSRDHEYKRHGTLSILAAVDLHNGEIFAQVHPRHRSREYILLLKELDDHYPKDCTLRVILDNHSAHISKETMAYLASRPNRFIYVHTPKHGSWLNLIETVFSRMARTFLKGIRVASREELKQRILQGVREMNLAPVVMRWKKFDLGLVNS